VRNFYKILDKWLPVLTFGAGA